MAAPADAAGVRRILTLAWPILIAQWATMAFGLIDTILTGHASADDLAAMSLSTSVYGSVLIGLVGVVLALNPILARHFGANDHAAIGRDLVQGLWLVLFLTVAGDIALSFPRLWLVASDVSPPVEARVAGYLSALRFALPAALLFRMVTAFNAAVARPKVTMAINLAALALKVPLSYGLLYGAWGLPHLGAPGCAVATAIVMWVSVSAAATLLVKDPFYRPFRLRFSWPIARLMRELLRLGIPTGLSYTVEVTSFTFMALLMGRLGAATTGGHQITASVTGLSYGIPFSIAITTSTLAAHALGAGDEARAARVVRRGLSLAAAVAVMLVVVVLLCRRALVGLYTDDPAVAAVALSLLGFYAWYHCADALQTVATFTLRAYQRAVAPMVIYTALLWGGGLGGGYVLAFVPQGTHAPLGARGIWLAATVSLALAAMTLLAYLALVLRQSRRAQAAPAVTAP